MADPWNLPQGRTNPLRHDDLLGIYRGCSSDTPCYGCGAAKPAHIGSVFVCDNCGRAVCNDCWQRAPHARDGCRLPAATPEGQAEEWAAEIAAGRVTPGGVIATGAVADVEGNVRWVCMWTGCVTGAGGWGRPAT